MKHSFLLALALSAFSVFAAESRARLDAMPPKDMPNVPISAVAGENLVDCQHPNWVKEEAIRNARLMYEDRKPLPKDSWTTYKFSFKADGSGKVEFQMGGAYAKEETDRMWVYVRNVKMNGKLWKNGDFKKSSVHQKTKKLTPHGFFLYGKSILVEDTGDGKSALLASHDNRVGFQFDVVEGETYEIEVDMMAAESP